MITEIIQELKTVLSKQQDEINTEIYNLESEISNCYSMDDSNILEATMDSLSSIEGELDSAIQELDSQL